MPNLPVQPQDTFWPSLAERQRPYPKNWLMRFPHDYSNYYKWCCLKCLENHSHTSKDTHLLSLEAHAAICEGDSRKAAMRHDLINAITSSSEMLNSLAYQKQHFGYVLIERGGLWQFVANELGWPKGYQGEDGWYKDYASAQKDMKIAQVFSNTLVPPLTAVEDK